MNAAKMLRLACERDHQVVIRFEGANGTMRQTPPVHVLAVETKHFPDIGSAFDIAFFDRGGRHDDPFTVGCAKIRMVHPVLGPDSDAVYEG